MNIFRPMGEDGNKKVDKSWEMLRNVIIDDRRTL
jgi:hypothetical protein